MCDQSHAVIGQMLCIMSLQAAFMQKVPPITASTLVTHAAIPKPTVSVRSLINRKQLDFSKAYEGVQSHRCMQS